VGAATRVSHNPMISPPPSGEGVGVGAAEAPAQVILRMEADLRDGDRVVLTVGPEDGNLTYAITIRLHIAVVAEAGLRTGQAVPPDLLARLRAGNEFQAHYNRALNFLAVRPRSESEVRRRLRLKAVPPHMIDAVVARLHRARYLDDAEFARYWLAERARTRPRGMRLLRGELREKGVASALIDQAVRDFEETAAQVAEEEAAARANLPIAPDAPDPADDPFAEGSRELREALILAERKARSYASLDPATFRRRLSGFLLRRGYGYDVVSKVVKEVVSRQSAVVSDDEDGEDEDGD